MQRLSLRARLAITSAVSVFAVSVVLGFLQYQVLTDYSIGRVDTQLKSVSSNLRLLDQLGRRSGDFDALLERVRANSNVVTQLIDENGNPVGEGDRIPVSKKVLKLAHRGAMRSSPPPDYFYTTRFAGTTRRVMAQFAGSEQGENYVLLIAHDIEDLITVQTELQYFFAAQALLSLIIAGSLGYFVTRQALRPVRRLALTTAEIANTGDLAKRVSSEQADSDLQRLSATFNQMLDTIESAYVRLSAALEAERRLVADASHELRTPLTTLKGNLDYLERVGRTSGVDPDVLEDLQESADRLTRLVAGLTQLARDDAGVKDEDTRIDFDGLVQDIADEPEFHEAGIELELESDLWTMGSEQALAAVVRNLFENARKYGGGETKAHAYRDGDNVVLDVEDNGEGFLPEEVDHAFDRFWRSDSARGQTGSGLGLSIVSSVIRAHGGEVKAFAGPGGHVQVRLSAAEQ